MNSIAERIKEDLEVLKEYDVNDPIYLSLELDVLETTINRLALSESIYDDCFEVIKELASVLTTKCKARKGMAFNKFAEESDAIKERLDNGEIRSDSKD